MTASVKVAHGHKDMIAFKGEIFSDGRIDCFKTPLFDVAFFGIAVEIGIKDFSTFTGRALLAGHAPLIIPYRVYLCSLRGTEEIQSPDAGYYVNCYCRYQ